MSNVNMKATVSTLQQLSVLQIGPLHNNFIIQADLIIRSDSTVARNQNIVFVFVQNFDLQESLQVTVFEFLYRS